MGQTQQELIEQFGGIDNHHRILTVFPRLISLFDFNHKNGLINYLTAKGYSVSGDANQVTGTKNEYTITAQFDDLCRLTNLKG